MKRIVVLAATEMEIAECRNVFPECSFVVSGMGAANAAIATIRAIEEHKPDVIVQIGIAGAIDSDLRIGEVVFVVEDYQADLGAWRERQRRFEQFPTLRIKVDNTTPFRSVKAQSVNTACMPYLPDSDAQIESMEGAAFFQAVKHYGGVKFVQIRSISNYVDSPRSEWQIPLAISVLPQALRTVLEKYS